MPDDVLKDAVKRVAASDPMIQIGAAMNRLGGMIQDEADKGKRTLRQLLALARRKVKDTTGY